MFGKIKQIHLVGIGGIGMSGIAEVLLNRGYQVTGSDIKESAVTQRLKGIGAKIFLGHQKGNIQNPQVVVVSSAIFSNNPEVQEAHDQGIPVIPRAEMLMELMRTKYGIAVSGSHGKTTTTSLIFSILGAAGRDPTAVIGGRLNSIGTNARLGEGDLFLAEADESDGSFLRLSPTLAVITNIDREHMNYFKDLKDLRKAFLEFANRVPFYGACILCIDDPEVKKIIPRLKRPYITYGLSPKANLSGQILSQKGRETHIEIFQEENSLGRIKLQIPGTHNIRNALCAVAVGLDCQVPFEKIKEGLEKFEGIERRFHLKKEIRGILVYDDYAHHPREIEATLNAFREVYPKRKLWGVFQPHRYSRLKDLFSDFVESLSKCDQVVLLPVYAASEEPIAGIDHESLAHGLKERGFDRVQCFNQMNEAKSHLEKVLQEGDLMVTLGAGDVWKLTEDFS